jgi:flagellar capping protein FliD
MEIDESKLKNILAEQREESQHFVEKQRVQFERFVEKERHEYQHYMGVLKEDFESKVQLVGEQYHNLTEMVGSMMEDVQIIKSDVQFLKGALKKKVDYEEFETLEKRVALLEAKVKK